MDISTHISQLLFEHDCVIVPGFGGFVCNYKPAEIHPIHHTVSPPSKAILFNRNLRSNDGLLTNYLANRMQISFDHATDLVSTWVNASNLLLNKNEEVIISKVGKLFNDVESNLQFTPDITVNYLKTSFGLRTLTAEPVIRGKVIEFTEKFKQETKQNVRSRNIGKVAAILLLLVSLLGIAELMWMGVEIKQLNLNEASVFSFLNRVFKTPEPEFQPLFIEIENNSSITTDTATEAASVEVDSSLIAETVTTYTEVISPNNPKAEDIKTAPVLSTSGTDYNYYVMVGAFAEEKNIEAAVARLQQRYPDSVILIERGKRLTKLGYSVGSKFSVALDKLQEAQQEDSSFWLLKK